MKANEGCWKKLRRISDKGELGRFGLHKAVGTDRKGRISLALYIAGILLTFVNQWIGVALYVLVAMIWFVPDKRFEKQIDK